MNELVPYSDLKEMAIQVVKGGLFPGIKTPEQALTLFLVAQAEGLHPMTATMRYNVIQNRPAMKAEAMLASFMERGGTVDWIEYTDEAVTGVFRSAGVPKGVSVRWTMKDAERAGLGRNPTWKSYPKQMLKARVASDGVRMCDPTVNTGRYTPEEVSEFTPTTDKVEAEIVPPEPSQELPEASLEPLLAESIAQVQSKRVIASIMGGPPDTVDGRLPDDPNALPEYCPECEGEVHTYKSRKGPDVRSCSFGRALWLETYEKTKNKETANRAASGHFYELQP